MDTTISGLRQSLRRDVDLEGELREARRHARAPLEANIIASLELQAHPNIYGLDHVIIDGGLYRPDQSGAPAFIVEAVQMVDGHFQLVDLVAALDRKQTATRRGVASMVGWTWWYRARMCGERLIVHPDVLAWLYRGGVGVAVLDWRTTAPAFLDVPRILVESDEVADVVYGAVSLVGRPPPIDVVVRHHG